MRQSESINEIATALGKAQREMMNPGFDKVNPHFKSKYASLAAVRDSIVNALSKQGIAVLQEAVLVDNGINCETRLFHSSGQWIACEPYRIPVDKGNAQGVASATTYARRISLQSFLVISADDDDDGGHAANSPPPAQRQHVEPSKPAAKNVGVPDAVHTADLERIVSAQTMEELRVAFALAWKQSEKCSQNQIAGLMMAKDRRKSELEPPIVQDEPGAYEPADAEVLS